MKGLVGLILVVALSYMGLLFVTEFQRRAENPITDSGNLVVLTFRTQRGGLITTAVKPVLISGVVFVDETSHWPREWFIELQKVKYAYLEFTGPLANRNGRYRAGSGDMESYTEKTARPWLIQFMAGFPRRRFRTLRPDIYMVAADFVPPEYSIIKYAVGELNGDKSQDAIVVVERQLIDGLSIPDGVSADRRLLILTGIRGRASASRWDGLELAAESDSTVYCRECGDRLGDPFKGVVINDGYFSVKHGGGKVWPWERTTTYKYSKEKRDWFLYRDGGSYYNADKPEDVEPHMSTTNDFGVVRFEDYKILGG